MIDYTAAGFTLLQGAHLYAPEDRGICDVLVANGQNYRRCQQYPF